MQRRPRTPAWHTWSWSWSCLSLLTSCWCKTHNKRNKALFPGSALAPQQFPYPMAGTAPLPSIRDGTRHDGGWMRRIIFLLLVLAGIGAFAAYWWLSAPSTRWSQTVAAGPPDAVNGETNFNIGGCSACHAVPNQPDRLKLGGGLAIPSPFGTFYAPNISPDPNDGRSEER